MIHIHAPSKHPSSMQTVEVFAKPGCSREPRKIPNESPFSAELRGIYNIVPFNVLFIVHTHFSFCDW